jgi:hypothetical protein
MADNPVPVSITAHNYLGHSRDMVRQTRRNRTHHPTDAHVAGKQASRVTIVLSLKEVGMDM